MNLDAMIAEAEARIQAEIDRRAAEAHAFIAARFAFARRSFGQRTRVTTIARVDPNKWAFDNGLESS